MPFFLKFASSNPVHIIEPLLLWIGTEPFKLAIQPPDRTNRLVPSESDHYYFGPKPWLGLHY